MRVLHVMHHSLPAMSGYTIRSSYITQFQREAGLDLVAATSAQHEYPGVAEEQVDGLAYLRTAPPKGPMYPGFREIRLMRAMQKTVRAAIKKWRPDIVHAHSPVLVGMPALIEARRARLPFVYEVRDLWENASVDRGKFAADSAPYKAARALETQVFKRADAVVTICEAMREEIAPRVGRNASLHVVANGVDTAKFVPLDPDPAVRDRWGVTGKRIIGYLGSFQPYEGLATLIEAMPAIAKRIADAHLLITGGQSDELEAKVAELGIGDHVTFTGRVPHADVHGLYAIADLMVYPRYLTRTTALTTPLKPLEAMAMSRPVLVSDTKAMLELVRPGDTGLAFEAGNAVDLADKACTVLEDPALAARLGEAGRAQVLAERHWPTIVDGYHAIYRKAQENRS